MNKEKINKILFYLYNYENIDDLIEQRKNEIIDTENVSAVDWIKSKQMQWKYIRESSNKTYR